MSESGADGVSRQYPERPIVGVGAVVLKDEKVLLIRRGREPMLGRWSLPGGALELGETLNEAAAREVLEETGLRVQPRAMVATLDRVVRDAAGRVQYHYVLVDWWCEVGGTAEPVAGDDADAARWVRLAEMEDAEYALEAVTLDVIRRAVLMAGAAER